VTSADTRPLSARSIALSTLLGTDPPILPATALVAVGELFGVAAGTTRTALSRMVATGELRADDGRYELVGGRLLGRRTAQSEGRNPPTARWNGEWHWVIVGPEGRSVGERREFRGRMQDHRLGELRPEVWLRPANLPAPDPDPSVFVTTGSLAGHDPVALAARLWDLESWAGQARQITAAVSAAQPTLETGGEDALPPNFVLSASVLRHLRRDPLLPPALLPPDWPGAELRRAYDRFDRSFSRRLRQFLRDHR
jgi:phenylacetic acid degradation operon negative regulatory protein